VTVRACATGMERVYGKSLRFKAARGRVRRISVGSAKLVKFCAAGCVCWEPGRLHPRCTFERTRRTHGFVHVPGAKPTYAPASHSSVGIHRYARGLASDGEQSALQRSWRWRLMFLFSSDAQSLKTTPPMASC
jgi:hypothetical protein